MLYETIVLALLSAGSFAFLGFLHGYKKGYGEGKIAGAFRTRAESVSR